MILHSKDHYIPLLNVEDTHILIVDYVPVQNQGLSIQTPTYISESRRHNFSLLLAMLMFQPPWPSIKIHVYISEY